MLPLAYALAAIVALILLLTWGALQVQVTLAGFLNGESVWSKAQKQAVIDLDTYVVKGAPADLADFRRNYAILESDRWARDAIAAGDVEQAPIAAAFLRGGVIPAAIPGIIFMLRHFPGAPYMKDALEAWHSTDASISEFAVIAAQVEGARADDSWSEQQAARQRERIHELNSFVEPRANRFSLDMAQGATELGGVLFGSVFVAAFLAYVLWLRMARRILAGIRGTEERYRLLFDSAADAIVMVDEADGRILGANRKASEWIGRDAGDLAGMRFADLFTRGDPFQRSVSELSTLRSLNGDDRLVETQSSLAVWGERSVRQAIIRDVTERVAMEQECRIAAEALGSIAEGVIIADAQRRVLAVNAAHTRMTGYTAPMLVNRRFDETRRLPNGLPLPPSIWNTIAVSGNWLGEVDSQRNDGRSYPELLSISAVNDADGQLLRLVAVLTDITHTKANQRRLEYMATHDPLTGLVNRVEFQRRCAQAIAVAARERHAAVVLFVDLDGFKAVNDSYNHAIGDRVLIEVADRICRTLRPDDVAGRIGGDEFTVLLSGPASREDAGPVAERVLANLAAPLLLDDHEIALGACVGVAGYPLDGDDPSTLITNADAAMYAAKTEERGGVRFYSPLMHADASTRLLIGADLRLALGRDEFEIVYQPSVELRSGRIVAVEALLRWRHPERGMLMPDEFIPIAESLGLIRLIDERTLQAVCAQMQAWDRNGMPAVRVAINASASTFGHRGFVEAVRCALQMAALPPSRLLIEITESAMLSLGEETERKLHALHALGVGVAIDDFGTGYSSLAYLKLPAVAFLKIDRSFVTGVPDEANDVVIVEAMLAIAKSLGLRAIAEGIETEAQHDFLLRLGCVEGQGFLYSRPLPPAEIERLLRPSRKHAPARLRVVPP
ncbi:hypothetical protein GCM10009105_04940 [Dokdonella soli]|uniref:EAL domain-containing protein n=1 Tax=Dokdonella soli TaxID=529810 RepID=A0ABN1ICG8_9GAMM